MPIQITDEDASGLLSLVAKIGHALKREKATEKPAKVEGGVKYYASDYACVPDPEKPSTWKLRLAEGESGNITVAQLGRAAAAFSKGGFRGNRVDLPDECPAEKIKNRIRSEYRKLGVDSEDVPDSIKSLSRGENTGFLVFKQDGQYFWLGIYSTMFRDSDRPVKEIISSGAHKKFISSVMSGEIPPPDLYLMHLKFAIGKATHLFWDDSGFAIALGAFYYNEIAEALMATDEDLAMSHGMLTKSIVRDDADPSIILEYISEELSVLPRDMAANKRTGFYMLVDGGDQLIENRERLAAMIGEANTAMIEESLQAEAMKAVEAGEDFKSIKTEETLMDESETLREGVEKAANMEDVEEEKAQEGADAETEMAVEEKPEKAEPEEMPEEEPEEMPEEEPEEEPDDFMKALADLRKEIVDALVPLADSVNNLAAKYGDVEKHVKKIEEGLERAQATVEHNEEKSVPETTSSIIEMLKRAQGVKSVIGSEKTIVKADDALADDAPVEAPANQNKGGLFFNEWRA